MFSVLYPVVCAVVIVVSSDCWFTLSLCRELYSEPPSLCPEKNVSIDDVETLGANACS